MITISGEKLVLIVLALSLVLMAGINIFSLLKAMPLLEREGEDIAAIREATLATRKLVDRLIEKLEFLAKSGEEAASWAEQLEDPLQGICADALGGMDEGIAQTEALLRELDAIAESEWPAWRDDNQEKLHSLLAQLAQYRRQLQSLRIELDQARGTILNLRSSAPRPVLSAVQSAALQARNVAIESELWQLRADRGRLMRELKQAEMALQEQQAATSDGETGADGRVAELEAQLQALRDENKHLEDLHNRTVLEKQFIEDAFVRLDDQLGLGKLPAPDGP